MAEVAQTKGRVCLFDGEIDELALDIAVVACSLLRVGDEHVDNDVLSIEGRLVLHAFRRRPGLGRCQGKLLRLNSRSAHASGHGPQGACTSRIGNSIVTQGHVIGSRGLPPHRVAAHHAEALHRTEAAGRGEERNAEERQDERREANDLHGYFSVRQSHANETTSSFINTEEGSRARVIRA